jgi:hypothetical protein
MSEHELYVASLLTAPVPAPSIPAAPYALGNIQEQDRQGLWLCENPMASPLYVVNMLDGKNRLVVRRNKSASVVPIDAPTEIPKGGSHVYLAPPDATGIEAMCAHIATDNRVTMVMVNDPERISVWEKSVKGIPARDLTPAALRDGTVQRLVIDRSSHVFTDPRNALRNVPSNVVVWHLLCGGDGKIDGVHQLYSTAMAGVDFDMAFGEIVRLPVDPKIKDKVTEFMQDLVSAKPDALSTPEKLFDISEQVNHALWGGKSVAIGEVLPPIESCSICMYEAGEPLDAEEVPDPLPLRITKCGHSFHASCINTWLERHNTTCPQCRCVFTKRSVTDNIAFVEREPSTRLHELLDVALSTTNQVLIIAPNYLREEIEKFVSSDDVLKYVPVGPKLFCCMSKPLTARPMQRWEVYTVCVDMWSLSTRRTVLGYLEKERIPLAKTKLVQTSYIMMMLTTEEEADQVIREDAEREEMRRDMDELMEQMGLNEDQLRQMIDMEAFGAPGFFQLLSNAQ